MKKSKKVALAAILCALSVLMLLLGSILTVLDLTMVCMASLLVMLAVIEIGGGYPYLIWLVTGVLAVLLLPDKFSALLYLLFGGIYPIFKAMFERLHYIVAWVRLLRGRTVLFRFLAWEWIAAAVLLLVYGVLRNVAMIRLGYDPLGDLGAFWNGIRKTC